MIRRILVFLAIIFIAFFSYRRYDRPAADNLLAKIKNFSLQDNKNYTTTVTNSDGTTMEVKNNTIGSSGFKEIINDTFSDKQETENPNSELIDKILIPDNITPVQQSSSTVSVVMTGESETTGESKIIITPTAPVSKPTPTPKPTPTVKPTSQPSSSQLSATDKRELEIFLNMFE